MKNVCVYTCVTGDYDDVLDDMTFKEKKFDYYLFTNNKNISSKFWKVVYIENDGLDNIRLARKIKILGHDLLKKYDVTVWIDGATIIRKKISAFLNDCCDMDKYDLIGFKHPTRDCIYDEAKACVIYGKEKKDVILKQMEFYESDNYPVHNGLIESAILVRKNNSCVLDKTMELWFDLIKRFSYRDQLSFNYAAYKMGLNYMLLDMETFDNEYFGRSKHVVKDSSRLKKCRVYFGDDSLENYCYDNDFIIDYTMVNDKYMVSVSAPVTGDVIKIRLDNIGKIEISSVDVKNVMDPEVICIDNIVGNDVNYIMGDNPTIIVNGHYEKNAKIKLYFQMRLLDSDDYVKIIDDAYIKMRTIESKVDMEYLPKIWSLEDKVNWLEQDRDRMINSNSWKITAPFRFITRGVKKLLKKVIR